MIKKLLLLVVVVLVAGFALDWFEFEKGKSADGKTKFGLVVDDDKIDEDTAKAKEVAKDLAGRAADGAAAMLGDGTVDGKVSALDLEAGWLSVKTDEGIVEIAVDGDVTLKSKAADATLGSLAAGEDVRVFYEEKDGVKKATRVRLRETSDG